MDASFNVTERLYHGSITTGLFRRYPDLHITESFLRLQRGVSHINERRLCNSLRPWCEIWDMLRGHSLVIARCVWDIKVLKNQIEMLQEVRLRELLDDSDAIHHADAGTCPMYYAANMRHTHLFMCDC
ncbi:hypothetical protein C8R44DRAFT_892255 [Mycena epipterygia]|nr:hypothetical protein C8R44DRAFT_892255 [Mycena epipterygia]